MAGNPSTHIVFGASPDSYLIAHGRRFVSENIPDQLLRHVQNEMNISMTLWIRCGPAPPPLIRDGAEISLAWAVRRIRGSRTTSRPPNTTSARRSIRRSAPTSRGRTASSPPTSSRSRPAATPAASSSRARPAGSGALCCRRSMWTGCPRRGRRSGRRSWTTR
ncbi:unnamed protein product [Mycena citricolor]|uniref:Uncharacterized protein n=1 Tax=Mycena citricolor TaxID=2018698 RepID=A0AAD2I1N6_9AGAR|nr:unnamed protein product [Mycena citricolor]